MSLSVRVHEDRLANAKMKLLEIVLKCPTCGEKHKALVEESVAAGRKPFNFACPDISRRYRLMSFYIDARRAPFRANPALAKIESEQAPIRFELGDKDFDQKFQRWLSIDYPPLGLIEEYPGKISEIINTYCSGYFYAAMTSAGCLGERILNRLVIKAREHFKETTEYKAIYKKKSFDDWDKMISLLAKWDVITHDAQTAFRKLMPYRHESIHYNDGYDFQGSAPTAINTLIGAITAVFGVINRKDIFWVFDVPGEVWVKSSAETLPFVKEFVLPHCYKAHAIHQLDLENHRISEDGAHIGPLTDGQFIEMRNVYLGRKSQSTGQGDPP